MPPTIPERIAAARAEAADPALRARQARTAIGLVDLTTLSGTDTDARVEALCARALRPGPGLPPVAAVCVFPRFVPVARAALHDTDVRVATVAGGFPHGQLPLALRLDEVAWCVDQGAHEIDMVISRGELLAGHHEFVHDEIAAHKQACGNAHLKVILETGELGDLDHVATASRIAIGAGADFIKTSTGKIQPAATLEVTAVMLDAIAAHHAATGEVVGIKPAGGLRTTEDARTWMALVAHTLGDAWITPERLRFGASSLLDDLVQHA